MGRKRVGRVYTRTVTACLLGAVGMAPVFADYPVNVLASFDGANGCGPCGGLILSGSTLYGTTVSGGPEYVGNGIFDSRGNGIVFSLPVLGGTPTVLAAFDYTTNGTAPTGDLTLSGSTLYGTTQGGGINNLGTAFSIPVTGGALTVLAAFDGINGAFPMGGLALSGSTLYGTAKMNLSTTNNFGTVFSVPVTGGTATVLATFDITHGANPSAGLLLSGSTLYGTTWSGGSYSAGTVFSLPVTGGTPTVLASFDSTNGSSPQAVLMLSGSTLYGTTYQGGAYGDGTVFSLPVTGGTPTVLASFDGTNGQWPCAGLTLSGDTLYGTTFQGGAYGDGTVFSVPVTGGMPTVLASFNEVSGFGPWGDLTLSGTTLYGTTTAGGVYGLGTVFSITIPEPSSMELLALGITGLLVRLRNTRRYPDIRR